jgi:hypothetical protein
MKAGKRAGETGYNRKMVVTPGRKGMEQDIHR